MAINKTINKRTNTHGAMRNCIEYVLRQDKTNELFTCVTGPYCHDEINYDLVYRTFLEEKKMWDKDSGRMYAHNIISWHKDEQITPEQALEFGKEFAENWFSGFQTLVAVHKDKDHIHCHLVTNSVSYEDGRKLHNTRKDLERMKQLTNQMCRERGLTVAEKGKHVLEALKKGPYGRCVFHCDNTVVDHQSVDIKFENQVTASFLMTAFTDQCARRIRLMGTKGEIKGDMDAGTIEIRDFVSGNLETIELHTPANGHNGSDMSMMHDFVRMVGEGRKGKTDAAVSVESHLMALAAEEARITGQVVNLRGFANENK